jgi:head-tail adaptor
LAAGRLRQVVQIQDPVEAQVEAGEAAEGDVETTGWTTTHANVRAEIDFGSPREMLLAKQVQAVNAALLTLRWRPGLHAKQRIVWVDGGVTRIFNFAGAAPDRYTGRTYVTVPVVEAADRPDGDEGSA